MKRRYREIHPNTYKKWQRVYKFHTYHKDTDPYSMICVRYEKGNTLYIGTGKSKEEAICNLMDQIKPLK